MRKNMVKILSVVVVFVLVIAVFMSIPANAGMAKGSKFVGNIIASSAPSNFATYWNQVTSENGGKWGTVQGTPGSSYNWGAADTAYNYARSNGMQYRYHCLVWGAQQPSGVNSASQVQTWINAVASRYGSGSAFVDVVNEPLHQVPSYSGVLGGNGSTGWDWVVKTFEMAHNAFPSSTKLCINDYGIISDTNAANNYVNIIQKVKDKGYIDGIGIQTHQFNMDTVSTSTMSTVLGILETKGLPIYSTELDITGDDTTQKNRYQEKFPVLYQRSSVQGITLWGYIEGQTWKSGTHLITSSGAERPALQWLKSYLANNGGPTPTPTRGATPTPTRPGGPTPTPNRGSVSIACGSSSAVGSFQADQYFSGGSTYRNSNTVSVSGITSNPPPAALFNNERYGAMSYTIPGFTAGSSRTVTLYFAETYLTASGRRLFSVSINGSTVLSNFDIYASAGGQNKAIARSFTATANSSGQIVIQFISGTENPKINGISIN